MKLSEQDMVAAAVAKLTSLGYRVATEVPFLGRSIDLVIHAGEALVAIEFKRRDWSRALMQARDHTLGADLAYVCVPRTRITERLLAKAEAEGIGVFGWDTDGGIEEQLPARPSPHATRTGRDWLLSGYQFRTDENA